MNVAASQHAEERAWEDQKEKLIKKAVENACPKSIFEHDPGE